MYSRSFKLFLLHSLFSVIASTKWLKNNQGFDNPESWISEYLPCSLEEVIFPEYYSAVLPLPSEVNIAGFTLPKDGAILLNQDAITTIGGDLKPQRNCENGKNREAYLKYAPTKKWYNSNSWRSTSDMSGNAAIPNMLLMPCNNESIIIQRNGPISIDLESIPFIRMGQLNLAGSLISKQYLQNLLQTDIGQMLFKNTRETSVEYYRNDICGCHRNFDELIEPICHNVVDSCQVPHCLMPVTPYESCCALCGAVLRFPIDRCNNEYLYKLRRLIMKSINEQRLNEDLDYFVHFINTRENGDYLQAIFVDKDTYNEKSVAFANKLNNSINWTKVFPKFKKMNLTFSGRPHNPNITFFSILLIMLCLIFVSIVALVIFAHYRPDHPYLNRLPRQCRTLLTRSAFVFARFDNIVGGDATDDHMEDIIIGYDAENEELHEERSFDNPMFEANLKDTETKEQQVIQMKSTASSSAYNGDEKLKDISPTNEVKHDEQHELTEIKLNSPTDSNDENYEGIPDEK